LQKGISINRCKQVKILGGGGTVMECIRSYSKICVHPSDTSLVKGSVLQIKKYKIPNVHCQGILDLNYPFTRWFKMFLIKNKDRNCKILSPSPAPSRIQVNIINCLIFCGTLVHPFFLCVKPYKCFMIRKYWKEEEKGGVQI
jgi:hypothetical protein